MYTVEYMTIEPSNISDLSGYLNRRYYDDGLVLVATYGKYFIFTDIPSLMDPMTRYAQSYLDRMVAQEEQ